MKIVLAAPFEEPVPPEKYGGTELVVSNIAETLVEKGHEVYMLATGDSKTKAKLIPTFPEAIRKNPAAMDAKTREAMKYMGIGKVVSELRDLRVDIVHNHIGWRLLPFASLVETPMVTTLHHSSDNVVYEKYYKHPYISISKFQASLVPKLNYTANVYNGIDMDLFGFSERSGEHLVFLSRISPEKGAKEAIEIAKRSGRKLIMAGKVDSADKDYFEREIKPSIDGKNVEFLGEIESSKKKDFLSGAYAMLSPIQWHEPFGLFLAEAMACGTPVVTTKLGSTSEIVADGETGFVVENDINKFVEVISKVNEIDRKKCYDRAKYFSKESMTEDYLKAYKKVINEFKKET